MFFESKRARKEREEREEMAAHIEKVRADAREFLAAERERKARKKVLQELHNEVAKTKNVVIDTTYHGKVIKIVKNENNDNKGTFEYGGEKYDMSHHHQFNDCYTLSFIGTIVYTNHGMVTIKGHHINEFTLDDIINIVEWIER